MIGRTKRFETSNRMQMQVESLGTWQVEGHPHGPLSTVQEEGVKSLGINRASTHGRLRYTQLEPCSCIVDNRTAKN